MATPERIPAAKIGRPTKLTYALIERVAEIVGCGNYFEVATDLCGVSRENKSQWCKTGRDARARVLVEGGKYTTMEKLCVAFLDAVEIAIARSDHRDLARVDRVAEGGEEIGEVIETRMTEPVMVEGKPLLGPDGQVVMMTRVSTTRKLRKAEPVWQASAWRLERRNPQRYGRRTAVAIDATVGGRDGEPLVPAATGAVLFYLPHNGRDPLPVIDGAPPTPTTPDPETPDEA